MLQFLIANNSNHKQTKLAMLWTILARKLMQINTNLTWWIIIRDEWSRWNGHRTMMMIRQWLNDARRLVWVAVVVQAHLTDGLLHRSRTPNVIVPATRKIKKQMLPFNILESNQRAHLLFQSHFVAIHFRVTRQAVKCNLSFFHSMFLAAK